MAVGILFIAKTPGYQTDLMSYLFGNILLVPQSSLWFMAALDAVLLLIVGLFHRQFLAVVFDEEFARLRGIPVTFYYLLLLLLVAVTVVLLIQVVGLILVLALLTLPAAIAGHYVHSLGRMMLLATLIGAAVSISGLALSYEPDLPAGATIVLVAGAVYILSALGTHLFRRRRARQSVASSHHEGGRRE
jgi:zinc transport system permease protein